jgi:hypothetical protein
VHATSVDLILSPRILTSAVDLDEAAVQLHVDPAIYPLQAIYGAADQRG